MGVVALLPFLMPNVISVLLLVAAQRTASLASKIEFRVVAEHACSAPSDRVRWSTAPDQPDPFGWLDQFVDELMPAVIR